MKHRPGTVLIALVAVILAAGCEIRTSDEVAIDHFVAGQLAMENQDYETALVELAKAIRADPDLSLAHAAIGDIRRKQGDALGAVVAYEAACRTNPYAFLPHYNLGVTCQSLARAAESAQTAARWIRKAVETYLRAVTLRPDDFDANLNLAACYYQLDKYDLAEQYCLRAVQISPRNPFGHCNLGIIYDAQNRPYDAIRAYKDSLELDTRQPKLLLNLGATYARLGRAQDALQAFRLAAQTDPSSAAPWEQTGACQYHQRQWDQAEQSYGKAILLEPRSPVAHRGLGVVYMTRYVLDGKPEELRQKALAEWNRSLELDPNQPELIGLVRKYTPARQAPGL